MAGVITGEGKTLKEFLQITTINENDLLLVESQTEGTRTMKYGAFAENMGSSEKVQQALEKANEAIEEIDKKKMDKASSISVLMLPTSWEIDSSNESYPYHFDILIESVTSADLAVLLISPASEDAARESNFSSTCETLDGAVRINAKNLPTQAITAELWILGGV